MNHLLENWQENKFVEEFEDFEAQSKSEFERNLSVFLETATARNMRKIVTLLLTNGAEVDGIPNNSKFDMPAAFVACYFGHHEVLKDLLIHSSLSFKSPEIKRNLLHQVCSASKTNVEDRRKCFNILLADCRCTNEIINGEDDKKFVPLYYAISNGFGEISKELLGRGAALDHSSVINHISKEAQKNLLREYMTNFAKRNSEDDVDDSKVGLMLGDPEQYDFEQKEKPRERIEKIVWYCFIALVCFFLVFSIIGIVQNIREGLVSYNGSEVHESGFRLKTKVIQSLVGGGRVKDPSMGT